MTHKIGELNEQPLHAALKAWYARPGDEMEVPLAGYVIDLVQGDELIEIQTGNFASIKTKIQTLVAAHPVRVVYPIAREKWLYKLPKDDWEGPRRRKSPKRGRVEEVFGELVSFPALLREGNFVLDVALIQEEEVRRYEGKRSWYKNGWVTVQRKLLDVVERRVYADPGDFEGVLTPDVPERFTTRDLAEVLDLSRWLAGKMAYCLREMGVIVRVGNRGRAYLYERG
jgi:hypothetical protein